MLWGVGGDRRHSPGRGLPSWGCPLGCSWLLVVHEEMEAQRGRGRCPRSHSQQVPEPKGTWPSLAPAPEPPRKLHLVLVFTPGHGPGPCSSSQGAPGRDWGGGGWGEGAALRARGRRSPGRRQLGARGGLGAGRALLLEPPAARAPSGCSVSGGGPAAGGPAETPSPCALTLLWARAPGRLAAGQSDGSQLSPGPEGAVPGCE